MYHGLVETVLAPGDWELEVHILVQAAMGLNASFAQCCTLLFQGTLWFVWSASSGKKPTEIELAVLELNFKGLCYI